MTTIAPITIAMLLTVGLVALWRFRVEENLVPRHVYLEFREGDKLIVNIYLLGADAHLADVSFIGEGYQVERLFTRGERAAGYAVRGATGVVFGNATIRVAADGMTVNGPRYPLNTMAINRDGEVGYGAIPECR